MPRERRLVFRASTRRARSAMYRRYHFPTLRTPLLRRSSSASNLVASQRQEGPMLATTPMSALELCDAIKTGKPFDASRLNRILGLDAMHGLLEVQAATPWQAIAAELRPGDARANVPTTMPTVGESIARNAAGPDGTPAVNHVASLTVVMSDGELRRVSRQRPHELIDAAIEAGGSFHIACTADATREQTEACYPQLKSFLAEKRRFDPHERLVNGWYLHQRALLTRPNCEVRWAS